MGPEQAEAIQVAWYDEGDEYRLHYDAFDQHEAGGQASMADGTGNRALTALGYLSTLSRGVGGQVRPHAMSTVQLRVSLPCMCVW